MTARILVVDDLEPNVKLLEAKLSAEYFDVVTAMNGPDAIEIAREEQPDIVLLDVMMPGMDGYEVCRRLKADEATAHIPVVMVTALDQQSDRLVGLEAGADDFLTKPVEDLALFARVRGLTRLKVMTDEFRRRYESGRELGLLPTVGETMHEMDMRRGRVALVADDATEIAILREMLVEEFDVDAIEEVDPHLAGLRTTDYDIIIVDLGVESMDALRLVSQLRSLDETRFTPILGVVYSGDMRRLVRALDMGVNDYIARPIDGHELIARMRTQYKRKVSLDRMHKSYQQSLELAVTDQLTGLSNRRYLQSRLPAMVQEAKRSNEPLALLILDIDRFKSINDERGHDAGDAVLREFGRCLGSNVRHVDVACRYGGEEFIVAAPNMARANALELAERLRRVFSVVRAKDPQTDDYVTFTVSIGVAVADEGNPVEDGAELITQADKALLAAKRSGRDRVVLSEDKRGRAA